jgi:hypothetical protein
LTTLRRFRRALSTATVLGQVMFLVAVAIGFLALGSFIGRDLSGGVALALSLGGLGLLIVQAVGGERFRVGGMRSAGSSPSRWSSASA